MLGRGRAHVATGVSIHTLGNDDIYWLLMTSLRLSLRVVNLRSANLVYRKDHVCVYVILYCRFALLHVIKTSFDFFSFSLFNTSYLFLFGRSLRWGSRYKIPHPSTILNKKLFSHTFMQSFHNMIKEIYK